MIPHIDENGEASIIVAISAEGRKKAAKVLGTVSLGNKAIKGVAKVREAMQASAAGRGEPPKMNMATSVASARQRLSDNRKASDAATIAAGFTPSKAFGGKLSNVRRADLANKVRDARSEATTTTNTSKSNRADRATAAAKEATSAAKKSARQASAQKGLATKAANKAVDAQKATRQASARRGLTTKAFNQQEAAKRSNKGKMSKSDWGTSPQARAPNAISKMQQSFPRRDRFQASGGFDRVSEKLGDRDYKSLKNLRLRS